MVCLLLQSLYSKYYVGFVFCMCSNLSGGATTTTTTTTTTRRRKDRKKRAWYHTVLIQHYVLVPYKLDLMAITVRQTCHRRLAWSKKRSRMLKRRREGCLLSTEETCHTPDNQSVTDMRFDTIDHSNCFKYLSASQTT